MVGLYLVEAAEPGRGWSPGCKEMDAFCTSFQGGAGETPGRVGCEWRLKQGVEAERRGTRGHQEPGVAMFKFQEH